MAAQSTPISEDRIGDIRIRKVDEIFQEQHWSVDKVSALRIASRNRAVAAG